MSCPFKDIFGKPREGVHSYRIFDIAIVDVIMTFGAAYLISENSQFTFIQSSLGLFVSGFILHWLLCVETTLTKPLL